MNGEDKVLESEKVEGGGGLEVVIFFSKEGTSIPPSPNISALDLCYSRNMNRDNLKQ